MQHKVKLTVIDKKLYPELQEKYCKDKQAGDCPMYNVGDEFIFTRYAGVDDFWKMGSGKQCSEAWDCISRYIYAALQGGTIMKEWMEDGRVMIACCNDGTRPVIFKIERLDYKAVYIEGVNEENQKQITCALNRLIGVKSVNFVENNGKSFYEVFVDAEVNDDDIEYEISKVNQCRLIKID